jgi:elongator complex protein 1
VIASTQQKPNKSDVIFIERNGLHHGGFTFQAPPTDAYVKELLWSADSAVLCAWCQCREDGKEWLQLWTVGNYHWYLKQEVLLAEQKDGTPGSLVGVLWDPVVPLKLHLLTAGEDVLLGTEGGGGDGVRGRGGERRRGGEGGREGGKLTSP